MAGSQKRKGAKHGRKTVRTVTASEPAAPKLTPKQEKFARLYIETGSAAKAYRLAYNCTGMNGNSVCAQACRLLDHPKIAPMVAALREELIDNHKVTADRIITEAFSMATSDMRRAAIWDADGVSLVDSSEIDDETAASIAEVSAGKFGPKIKFHDKSAALEKIAKMMHLYEDENDKKHARITVEIVPIAPTPKPAGKERKRLAA